MHCTSERELTGLALALGAASISGWSDEEHRLARQCQRVFPSATATLRDEIAAGNDPLGEMFCMLRSSEVRRGAGATYTPPVLVAAMVELAASLCEPGRVVDPGIGSGRFLVEAGRRFPDAALVGIETDALAAMIGRANLAVAGMAARAEVILADYRSAKLPAIDGPTLFLGNPPYVRHHRIERHWKEWFTRSAAARGVRASQLAGLHVHFFLATLNHVGPGDCGMLVTAAEWLDVNYGSTVRSLHLDGLGGERIVIVEPSAAPFPDAATTAAIVAFRIGDRPRQMVIKRVTEVGRLDDPSGSVRIDRSTLHAASRWSQLTCRTRKVPANMVELGELCRVHRGQVTGANRVWLEGEHSAGLPSTVLYPAVTKARELFEAAGVLEDVARLRRAIDLPVDLNVFDRDSRLLVERFLAYARRQGAHAGYVAKNRRAWWSVGLRDPAPILATYMARRPPAFVLNPAGARHINIAHGLYPRTAMDSTALAHLAKFLSRTARLSAGRTYAGGLTKFEPREMERMLVPRPAVSVLA